MVARCLVLDVVSRCTGVEFSGFRAPLTVFEGNSCVSGVPLFFVVPGFGKFQKLLFTWMAMPVQVLWKKDGAQCAFLP